MHHLSLGGIRAQDHTSFSPSKQRRRHRRLCLCVFFLHRRVAFVSRMAPFFFGWTGVGEETTCWGRHGDKEGPVSRQTQHSTQRVQVQQHLFGTVIFMKFLRVEGSRGNTKFVKNPCDISHGDRDVAMAHPWHGARRICDRSPWHPKTSHPEKYCKQTSNNAEKNTYRNTWIRFSQQGNMIYTYHGLSWNPESSPFGSAAPKPGWSETLRLKPQLFLTFSSGSVVSNRWK